MHPRKLLAHYSKTFPALISLENRVRGIAYLVFGVLILGIVLQTWEAVTSVRREALDNAVALNEKLVMGDEARIRQTLAAIDTALGVIVQDVQGSPRYGNAELQRRMGGLHLDPAHRPVITVADASGKVLAVGTIGIQDPEPSSSLNVADRDYFIRQRDSLADALQIGVPLMSRKFKVMVLPVTRKIRASDGSFGGLVTLSIKPDTFSTLSTATILEANSVHALLNSEGRVLVRQMGGQLSYGENASGSLLYQYVGNNAIGSFTAASPIDGVLRLTSYRLLQPYGIIALYSSSRDEVLQATAGHVRRVLFTGGAMLLLCLLLLLVLRSAIQRRRKHLLGMARMASREVFLLEQIPVMFLFARAGAQGLVIFKCNEHLLQALELRSEDVLGQRLDWLLPGLDPLAAPGDSVAPVQLRSPSGKTVYAMVTVSQANSFVEPGGGDDAGPAGAAVAADQAFCISLTDVSQSVELQRALFTKDLNFQRLLDVLPEHIRIFDDSEALVWSNFNASEYFGIRHDQAALTLAELNGRIHAEDLAHALANRKKLIETGLAQEATELRLQRFDGVYRWFSVRLTSMLDEAGALQKLIAVCTDIDDRKRLAERTAISRRLETTGQLAGGMAHDFNNLLSIIIGNLDLARLGVQDPETDRQLGVALGAAERGANLVKSLLTLASQQVLTPVVADMNAMLGGMLPLLLQAVGPRVRVSQRLHGQALPVLVDVARLESCLLNLAVNARDAMPDGGTLDIQVGLEPLGQAGQEGDWVCLAIADTGTGMSAEVQRRALEPFFTTKERGRGTGLGLAMVAGFVHQSGGQLDIASERNVGTTIRLRLPLCRLASPLPAATSGQIALRTREGTILVVDDEVEIAQLIATWCRHAGYNVHIAHGVDAAMDVMLSDRVDLVVSDVVMPGKLNGFDLVKFIREEFEHTQVMLLSGYSPEALAQDGVPLFPILFKPVRQNELLETVARLLRAAPADNRQAVLPARELVDAAPAFN